MGFILVDSREPEIIPKRLGELAKVVFLPYGDYWFYTASGGRVCIERKTIADLLNSLREGRLQQQLRRMLQEDAEVILLIEGYWTCNKDFKIKHGGGLTGWDLASLSNFLLTVQREGTRLVYSPNQGATVYLLVQLYRYYQKPKHKALTARPKPLFFFDDLQSRRVYFLMGLPGIGEELAHRILAKFPLPGEILLSPERLAEVPGVGTKKINEIVKILGYDEEPEKTG